MNHQHAAKVAAMTHRQKIEFATVLFHVHRVVCGESASDQAISDFVVISRRPATEVLADMTTSAKRLLAKGKVE